MYIDVLSLCINPVHNYNAQFEVSFLVVTDTNQPTTIIQQKYNIKHIDFYIISMWTSCLFLNSTIWLSHDICRHFLCISYGVRDRARLQNAFYNTYSRLSLFPFWYDVWFVWKCQLIKSSINWNDLKWSFPQRSHISTLHSYTNTQFFFFHFVFDCDRVCFRISKSWWNY